MGKVRFHIVVNEVTDFEPILKWGNEVYKKDFRIVDVQEVEIDLVLMEGEEADLGYMFQLGAMYGREMQRKESRERS